MFQVFAKSFLPVDETSIPTGEIASVSGSVFDLQQPQKLGEVIPKVVGAKCGYDHNFCLERSGERKLAVRLEDCESGRVMETYTTQPGVQVCPDNCSFPLRLKR